MVCSDGEVALVDDGNGLGMRVDVCKEGVWGVVSGVNWNNLAAEVACQTTSGSITEQSPGSSDGMHIRVCCCSYELFTSLCEYPLL